ncbi:LysE family translocator [Streptomyces sp. NPDC050856]|uniref:LysE family translocator n=1 Tax=Streptomyces sp. NPDC050856 TaxID=3154939 RepID=UPI0033F85F44
MSVDLAGFLAVVVLAYVIPGPDFLVVVRSAARRRALGLAAAAGAQCGLCVHMLAAAAGLSALATTSAAAFTAVKLAGALYLVYLGVRALRDARRTVAARPGRPGRDRTGPDHRGVRSHFAEGLLTNVLNPKAALFFLSVLPQFVDRDAPLPGQILLLGLLDVAVGAVYWAALVALAGAVGQALDRPAVRRRWERVTGWLFIAIGCGVATSG